MAFGCYNYWRSDHGSFVWAANSTWGGENLITAVLLFTFLMNVNTEKYPQLLREILSYISQISLGIYLVSWIFDRIIYDGYVKALIPVAQERWKFYPVAVPVIFIGAVGCAACLYLIRDGIHKVIQICRKHA